VHSDNLVGWLVTQLVALGALLASLAGWIPYAIVAAIPTIYYLLMIWEMKTVVHWRNNWVQKRIARKYARLKAREKVTLAKLEAMEVQRRARVAARETIHQAEFEAEKLVAKNSTLTKALNASDSAVQDLKNLNAPNS
jgi:hypothetical protein